MTEDKKEQQPEENYTRYMQELEEYPAFDRQKAYDDWKNGSKPILEALISNYRKPEQTITPEQERRIRTASALTDGLTTLAEMFAHGRGAYVRPRQGESNQQKTNSRLQEIKDKYEQDLMRYNSARSEAEMRDFSDYLRSSMAAHSQKRENLLLKTRNAWDAERTAENLKEQKRQFDIRQAEIERSNKEQKRQFDVRQAAEAGGANKTRGYIDLQDRRNNYVQLPPAVWNITAQEIYNDLAKRGIIPRLTTMVKNEVGLYEPADVRSPGQIAAHVAQYVDSFPDDTWEKLYARQRREGYTDSNTQVRGQAPSQTSVPQTAVSPQSPVWGQYPVWQKPKERTAGTQSFNHPPY